MQHDLNNMNHMHCHKHYSWSPIIIGALVGLGLGFLLNLFSVAIGLSIFTTDPQGAKMIALGGFIGLIIGTIATMYTAGFTAGYLSGSTSHKNYGVIYGFAAWALGLIFMALLANSIGKYVVEYDNFISQPRMEQAAAQMQATAKAVSNQTNPTVSAKSNETEKEVKTIGMQSFMLFVLFFIGAFSSALGGYIGADCYRKCCNKQECR